MTLARLPALFTILLPCIAVAEVGDPQPEAREAAIPTKLVMLQAPALEPETDVDELTRIMSSYLADLEIEIELVESELPVGPFEQVQARVVSIASDRGATYAVWSRPANEGTLVLFIAHVQGGTAFVRTMDLSEEPPAMLRRTISAVVRTVLEGEVLETTAEVDGHSPVGATRASEESDATETPPAEVVEVESSLFAMGLQAGYGLRWLSAPGPAHQAVSLGLNARLIDWIGFRVAGRLAIPVEPPSPDGGEVWRASLVVLAGLERPVSILQVGFLAGVDIEWLWGDVGLSDGRGQVSFDHLGIGIALRAFLRVRLYRGISLHAAVDTTIRPDRKLYLLQRVPVVSTGYADVGVELGITWNFYD